MNESMPIPDDLTSHLDSALARLIQSLTSLRSSLALPLSPESLAAPLLPLQTGLLSSIYTLQSSTDHLLDLLATRHLQPTHPEPDTTRTESETIVESPVLRVLIGDPDPANLERLTGWTQDAGHLVWPCVSFEDAIQKASTRPFNLIILDDRLPRFDQGRVLGTLASRDEKDIVNLVLITADPENHLGIMCLTPPVSPDDLDRTLRNRFSRK